MSTTDTAAAAIERQVAVEQRRRDERGIVGPWRLLIPAQLWIVAGLPVPYDLNGNVIVRVGGVRVEPGIFRSCVPVQAR